MRKVDYDPSKVEWPEDLMEKAAKLTATLKGEADQAKRVALIEENQNVWKAAKVALKKLFNGKCWYTESPQAGTDVDVDHFRPKGRVADVSINGASHPGYWWLAFNLANYRYSSIVANRRRRDIETDHVGGKADHFPIWNEADRATNPDADYENEKPLLIDPCKASDVSLITFKEDGEAMPRWDADQPYKNLKAIKSIDLYHLNHSDFVKARIVLRDQVYKHVSDARRFFVKLETGDADHERAYEAAISGLIQLCHKDSPYSSFCLACLSNYKRDEYLAGAFS